MTLFPENIVPSEDELPAGFLDFFWPIYEQFEPRRRALLADRAKVVAEKATNPCRYIDHPADHPIRGDWKVRPIPENMLDHRVEITLPADSAKMIIGGYNGMQDQGETYYASWMMLDYEDSLCDTWEHLKLGIANARAALTRTLRYQRGGSSEGMDPDSKTVICVRVRGMHMTQELGWMKAPGSRFVSAQLFDLCMTVYKLAFEKMPHDLVFYFPKTESANEGRFQRDVLQALAVACGLDRLAFRCKALVERFPMAYQMEEYLYETREHCIGLNSGRYDYTADYGRFTGYDPGEILPDRLSIPFDAPFLQNLGIQMVNTCHRRGAFAITGMTQHFPAKDNEEVNERHMAKLLADSLNGVKGKFCGKWIGHPKQIATVLRVFTRPNQLDEFHKGVPERMDVRPSFKGVGTVTLASTLAGIRTSILYRAGVLQGVGAVMISYLMEDLATDLLIREELQQRIGNAVSVPHDQHDGVFTYTHASVAGLYDRVLRELIAALPAEDKATALRYGNAARISYEMVRNNEREPS